MKFLVGIFTILFTTVAIAATVPDQIPTNVVPSSFRQTIISKVNGVIAAVTAGAINESQLAQPISTNVGLFPQRMARFMYTTAGGNGVIGAYDTGVDLPAKAVITRSFFVVNTQFVDAGSGTVAISCEDANNIKTATDITGSADGAIVEGESTGAASAFKSSIAAACPITVTVAGADQTAGSLTGFVEYYVLP